MNLIAVVAADVAKLESLLEGEAKVNTDGFGLLSHAIENGTTDIVKTLVRHGFDVNLGWPDLVEFSRKSGGTLPYAYSPFITPLRHQFYFSTLGGGVRYSWRNDLYSKSIQILLDNGADVDELHGEQTTILHHVAACGCIEIMKVLINEGADRTAVDKVGSTPLDHFLIAHRDGRFLSEYGSDDGLDDVEITESVASLLAPNEEALQKSLEKYLKKDEEDEETES